MELGTIGRSQRSHRPPNPNAHSNRSRFGSNRDYVAKHRALRQHRPKVEEAPNRALPPPPGLGRNTSGSITSAVSNSLKRMFMTPGSYGSQSQHLKSWQDRDIYFYNGSAHRQQHQGLYLNAFDQFSHRPLPQNPNIPNHPMNSMNRIGGSLNPNLKNMNMMNMSISPSPMMRPQLQMQPQPHSQSRMIQRRLPMGNSYNVPQPPMALPVE